MPQLLRGFGMMFAIVPITNISLGTLAPERLKNASGLFNLTRNLGGAVGLAGLNTVLDRRIDLHLARLHDSITWARRPVLEALTGFAARMPGSDAQNMALKQLFLFARSRARSWPSPTCSCCCAFCLHPSPLWSFCFAARP